jgi:hypothetical protein
MLRQQMKNAAVTKFKISAGLCDVIKLLAINPWRHWIAKMRLS